ncbi:hypothetical protein EB796_003445 [Bugula neritina]|uniref:Uncharacterized protein n=1 Tax=Bugula neritina TaxID=10212 RepID=A0A7J7KJ50_BUGNE|nr:hypothetical protein EB796_003445 [Bugula neritina]
MPGNRVPQNSASSTHQRILTDLQTVYQKIIQTGGPLFPLRSKDSVKSTRSSTAHYKNRLLVLSAGPVSPSRAKSAGTKVEEIVIKPLCIHDRNISSSRSWRNSSFLPPSSGSVISVDFGSNSNPSASHSQFSVMPDSAELSSARRCRSSVSSAPSSAVEYSEQSIRYVAEQVSLEQARQLKLRSNITEHRLDKKYFVSGSKVKIRNHAFVNESNTSSRTNYKRGTLCHWQSKTPNSNLNSVSRRDFLVKGNQLKDSAHGLGSSNRSASSHRDPDETSIPTVSIPTASAANVDTVVSPSNDISNKHVDD